jgi:putative hydrolase of the HAD superfamily
VIKTVIFDLGGVIVPLDFKLGYARMEPLCRYTAAEIPKRLRQTDLVTRYEIGAIESPAFVAQLSELLGLKVSYSEFCELWSSIFLPETLIQEPLLQRIRERHRLLLLSNTNDLHFSMIERTYPILRLFDDRVLSYKVGASKPAPRIYEEAIARAGCRPEECLFIDDVPAFVEGARKAGIDAVQFESEEQVERELLARGVL